ncbi:MAG: Trk system potassium transporter TrkA, partial [Burkholderiales bacterium]|nr:Trk system potassium transporter TrkA [Burkholderiales bacterium]
LITYPETLQVIEFDSGELLLLAVKVVTDSKMAGQPISKIRELVPEAKVQIISAGKPGKKQVTKLKGDSKIEAGFEVSFLTTRNAAFNVIQTFRSKTRKSDRVMIAGGGSLGLQLARALDDSETLQGNPYNIKILESNMARCQYLSQHLSSSVLVLNVDMTDETLFINEGIANTDVFVAVTNDDEDNFMSCLLAKKLGAHRTITIINRVNYIDLVEETNIDIAFSPTEATLSELLKHIRQGDVVSAHALRRGGEILELVAHGTQKTSDIIGKKMNELNLSGEAKAVAIIRKTRTSEQVYMSYEDVTIEDGDHVIIFVANHSDIPKVEKKFTPKVNFF